MSLYILAGLYLLPPPHPAHTLLSLCVCVSPPTRRRDELSKVKRAQQGYRETLQANLQTIVNHCKSLQCLSISLLGSTFFLLPTQHTLFFLSVCVNPPTRRRDELSKVKRRQQFHPLAYSPQKAYPRPLPRHPSLYTLCSLCPLHSIVYNDLQWFTMVCKLACSVSLYPCR